VTAIPATRLYGAAIALVSGVYSLASALGGGMGMMPMSDSIMVLVGLVVIAHGVVLLTPVADRIGAVSGPLMILWAAIMLANQAVATMSDSMMGSWDGGMVALALLMLASGAIMSRRAGE
jgi:K+ transporter